MNTAIQQAIKDKAPFTAVSIVDGKFQGWGVFNFFKEQAMNPDDNYDFDLEAGEDFADGYVTGCDPEEYEDDWDGQPDEAQEWHDFNPDC